MLSVLFLRSSSIIGWLIRLITRAPFNHVAIIHKGRMYESDRNGVVEINIMSYLRHNIEIRNIPTNISEHGLQDNIDSLVKVSKPLRYDYTNLLLWQPIYQLTGRWIGRGTANELICSEFVARVLEMDDPDRISPKNLYKLSLPVIAQII